MRKHDDKSKIEFLRIYGEKLTLVIDMDGKTKTYRPNKDSVKNIIGALGSETKLWIGKTLILNVISIMGKESVLAVVDKSVATLVAFK